MTMAAASPAPSPLRGIQAAIIDLDGTMLHTMPDFHLAINRMLAELWPQFLAGGQVRHHAIDFIQAGGQAGGQVRHHAIDAKHGAMPDLTPDAIALMVGKGSEHLIRSVLAVYLEPDAVAQQFAAAMAAYQRHYLAINGDHSTLYPDVLAGLEALKAQGLRLACVTNKPIAFARPLLAQKGLAGYFEVVYGGDSLAQKKPHPLPLLQVCADFGLAPAQVVAIGDSSNDAQAARAAGCPVLTVPYGYNHGESIHDTDSDGIVDTLLHAADLIRLHNQIAN